VIEELTLMPNVGRFWIVLNVDFTTV
jgi:hypothetical protein